MKRVALGLALIALAACGETVDPLETARAQCAQPELEPAAQIAACEIVLDSADLSEEVRSAALGNRGTARLRAGEVTPALSDFSAALEANENNMHAAVGRAAILVDSGQLDAAQPLVERVLASGEFQDRAHFLDGNIAAQRGDAAAAIAAYDAAIAVNPRLPDVYANRARMRAQQEDFAAAIADYSSAIEIDRGHANAHSGRCWARIVTQAPDADARADADAAVAADPRMLEAQLCRGLLQLRAEDWAGARASYEAALEIQPGNPAALFGRGVARRRAGDSDGRQDMNQARDFDRHVAESFAELGVRSY